MRNTGRKPKRFGNSPQTYWPTGDKDRRTAAKRRGSSVFVAAKSASRLGKAYYLLDTSPPSNNISHAIKSCGRTLMAKSHDTRKDVKKPAQMSAKEKRKAKKEKKRKKQAGLA